MNRRAIQARLAVAGALLMSTAACAAVRPGAQPAVQAAGTATTDAAAGVAAADTRAGEGVQIREDDSAARVARARSAVPGRPDLAQPSTVEGTQVWKQGVLGSGRRILVDTENRALWLMEDTLVLFSAPVAVGMQEEFEYRGRTYDFTTPISRRSVLAKDTMPIWVPPDWHYFEIAVEKGLDVVQLKPGSRIELGDSTRIEVRGNEVGRVNQFGNFWAFTPGSEIIFDGKVFIPPFGTKQRQVPDVLGTHKLVLGDGYLIHGTNEETSIGDAVSHGCVRMYNEDVSALFAMVPVGTAVYIY